MYLFTFGRDFSFQKYNVAFCVYICEFTAACFVNYLEFYIS